MVGTSKKTYEEVYKIIDEQLTEIAEAQGKTFGKGMPLPVTKSQKSLILAKVQVDALTSEFVADKCFKNYVTLCKIRMVESLDLVEIEKAKKVQENKKKRKEMKEVNDLLEAKPQEEAL